MKTTVFLFLSVLFTIQNAYACSCSEILPFKQSIKNISEESNILILGEISDFVKSNSRYDWHEYVAVNPVKDYMGNVNGEEVFLSNGPESACIKEFDYGRGSQLIILAIQTDRVEDEKPVFRASFCQDSVLYYDRENDVMRGSTYSTSLPQTEMTLHEIEQLIKSSMK